MFKTNNYKTSCSLDHLLESSWKDHSHEWSQLSVWLRNKDFTICDAHLIWDPVSVLIYELQI